MNDIKIFSSPQFGEVRTAGTSEQPLFCLADVCKALHLRATKVAQRLEGDVLSKHPILDNLGREQQATFVNEDGLYDAILDSRKPIAKKFRKWITSEVLPSIRKTGGYIATKPEDTPEEIMARALTIAKDTLTKREHRIKELEVMAESQQLRIEEQTKQLTQSAPKVQYYDDVLQSTTMLTTTQIAKSIGMEANKLNKKLEEIGILYKQSGQWLLRTPFDTWKMHGVRTLHTHARTAL